MGPALQYNGRPSPATETLRIRRSVSARQTPIFSFAKVENLSKYAKLQRKTAIPVTPVHTEHSDYSAPTG